VRNVATLLGIILVILLLVALFGGAGMMGFGGFGMGPGMMSGYGMHGFGGPFGFGFSPLGWILSLVFWALIIGGIVLLAVWLARSAGQTSVGRFVSESTLEILKTRYAKGEITREQFNDLRKDLGV
jgi:putative membrane protein